MIARKRTPSTMPDGTPLWLPKVERSLIGGCMLAMQEDVQMVAGTVLPSDFLDETLGMILEVLPYVEEPSPFFVAQALWDNGNYDAVGGEPRLVDLMGSWSLLVYSAPCYLEAHATWVHEWGEKRRRLRELSEEAKAIYEGKGSGTTHLYDRPEYQNMTEAV